MKDTRYAGVLADLDGTVNRGSQLIYGADRAYRELSSRGIRWIFASNSATRLACDLADKINGLGLPVVKDQVINSASAAIAALEAHYPGARLMVVGEPRLVQGLTKAGALVTDNPEIAKIVLVAMDTGFTYNKLKNAHRALGNGALFWATNLDSTFPFEDGFLPGAGSIVASIATAIGRQPDRVFGKPSPDMAMLALRSLNMPSRSCLVVGDRMDTDILFAKNAGMDSVLVLTGATSREDLDRYTYSPTYVLDSIFDIIELFDGSGPSTS